MDIIAERLSQDPDNRAAVKRFYVSGGSLKVKGVGDEAKKALSTYQMYWEYSEPLSALKPHRVLAINRGEREGELEVSLAVDEEGAVALLQARTQTFNRYHREAIDDGLRRLLGPAVLREIRTEASEFADGHGIVVFSENLRNLLHAAANQRHARPRHRPRHTDRHEMRRIGRDGQIPRLFPDIPGARPKGRRRRSPSRCESMS